MTKKTTTQAHTFEEKLLELEQIIAWFESDKMTLAESMTKFERGMELCAQLEQELKAVQAKVTLIKQKFDVTE